MRKLIYLLIFISANCYSQLYHYGYYIFNFEDTTHHGRLIIDTLSNPDNIWQIGAPSKNIFNEAFSVPNAIITDTIIPYPANDTSSFTVIHRASIALSSNYRAIFSGYYKVDSDSLNDFGMIELSPDNGITWYDMLIDPSFIWDTEKPVLTGSSDWTFFWVEFDNLGYELNFGDSIQFRFTFISDDIQSNRDGLMFDDLVFEDFYEGIFSQGYDKFRSVSFPNPAEQWLVIEYENVYLKSTELEIIDGTGRLISRETGQNSSRFEIDISSYQPGSYFYRIFDPESNRVSHGKFIIN